MNFGSIGFGMLLGMALFSNLAYIPGSMLYKERMQKLECESELRPGEQCTLIFVNPDQMWRMNRQPLTDGESEPEVTPMPMGDWPEKLPPVAIVF